jgi:peroxiredoxin
MVSIKRGLPIFIGFAFFVFHNLTAQSSYEVRGSISKASNARKAFLLYRNVRDSALIKDGKFVFKGKITLPVKATLNLEFSSSDKTQKEYADFFLDPGITSINAFKNLKSFDIQGGLAQSEYLQLSDSLLSVTQVLESISILLRKGDIDEEMRENLFKIVRAQNRKKENIENAFIKKHPASEVSWDIVQGRAIIIDPGNIEPAFNSLDAKLLSRPEAVAIKERIEIAKRIEIGKPAIEFSSPDTSGNLVALSSFKGIFVLVDFWASWCGPCRVENPNMLKAYEKLKNKKFEIFGVSLDDNRDRWIKAIGEDRLPWVQVSDLKGFNSVAKLYGIRAIPQNLLLDPNGTIIAKNLRGVKLEEEINKIIDQHHQ